MSSEEDQQQLDPPLLKRLSIGVFIIIIPCCPLSLIRVLVLIWTASVKCFLCSGHKFTCKLALIIIMTLILTQLTYICGLLWLCRWSLHWVLLLWWILWVLRRLHLVWGMISHAGWPIMAQVLVVRTWWVSLWQVLWVWVSLSSPAPVTITLTSLPSNLWPLPLP